jgi:hypothetical protein
MSEEKEKGFVVKDRRAFTPEGQTSPEEKPEAPQREKTGKPAAAADAEAPKPRPLLPEINFPTFVASLNASALVHLGVIDDPVSGQREKELSMAKQTIDILSLLQQKTAGNLTPDEDSLLKSILYDLRMLYVKERK